MNIQKTYAGIGARDTPSNILNLMTLFAEAMVKRNIMLRTGGAVGADQAFLKGIGTKTNLAEIFTPWKSYEANFMQDYNFVPTFMIPTIAYDIAKRYHSNWLACNSAVQKLHARNAQIILGEYLNTPVDYVITWTKQGRIIGGTGLGLRIAKDFNIPIFNMGNYSESDIIINLNKFVADIISR